MWSFGRSHKTTNPQATTVVVKGVDKLMSDHQQEQTNQATEIAILEMEDEIFDALDMEEEMVWDDKLVA